MTELERLAKEIFEECKGTEDEITMEEAEEMAKMEIGASKIKNYVQSEPEKKKKVERPKKEDVDKNYICSILHYALQECDEVKNPVITNMGKMLEFDFRGKPYTLDLKFARNKYKARVDK